MVTPEQIQEAIYVPSRFKVNNIEPGSIDSLKVVTIRTEGLYDRMDINYLGLQMRQTDKKIYGLESEFACPLIIRVFMDPSEDLDEDWYEDIVEMETLDMPIHGGGTREIEVDFEFVKLEKEVGSISTEDFIRNMFMPFNAEFKSRVQENAGKKQYIYEIADEKYDKPIYKRNMPYLSSHDGGIGVYINLNKDLVPSVQVRFAEPMTAEKIWELMTMPVWTITYKKGEVKEEGAKIAFSTPGVVHEYR